MSEENLNKWLGIDNEGLSSEALDELNSTLETINNTITTILNLTKAKMEVVKGMMGGNYSSAFSEIIEEVNSVITSFLNDFAQIGGYLMLIKPDFGGKDYLASTVSKAFNSMQTQIGGASALGGICIVHTSSNAYKVMQLMTLFKEFFGVNIIMDVNTKLQIRIMRFKNYNIIYWVVNDLLFIIQDKNADLRVKIYRRDTKTNSEVLLDTTGIKAGYKDETKNDSLSYYYRVEVIDLNKSNRVIATSNEYFLEATVDDPEGEAIEEAKSNVFDKFEMNRWWGFSADKLPMFDLLKIQLNKLMSSLNNIASPATSSMDALSEIITSKIDYYSNLITRVSDIIEKITKLLDVMIDLNIRILTIPVDLRSPEEFADFISNSNLDEISGSNDLIAGGVLMFVGPNTEAITNTINFFQGFFGGKEE